MHEVQSTAQFNVAWSDVSQFAVGGEQRIRIAKQAHKFAAAHMTVFGPDSKEPLHGHNFEVTLDARLGREWIPFKVVKDALKDVCDAWDERVLLQAASPYFARLSENEESLEFTVCGKRYLLPKEEIVLLPVENVTTEELSRELCRRLVGRMGALASAFEEVEVTVSEGGGQSASFRWKKPVIGSKS